MSRPCSKITDELLIGSSRESAKAEATPRARRKIQEKQHSSSRRETFTQQTRSLGLLAVGGRLYFNLQLFNLKFSCPSNKGETCCVGEILGYMP